VKEKATNINAVTPDYLIGADVSCLMNIAGRLSREGKTVKVLHIVDVLMSNIVDDLSQSTITNNDSLTVEVN
ncbi:MAG: (Fe-S)-binding protein, partial [Moritella sp.]|nr:(Fe-S)-binding protein [Moritella sp.]